MTKLGIFASLFAIVGAITFASMSSSQADGDGCQRKEFKTEMVKSACDSGGQKAAKAAMQKFMKEAKIKSCQACHTKLAPTYELKADGLDQFKKAGGK